MTTPPPYPPEPWYLGGELLVSAFALPSSALPRALFAPVPDGHRPLVVRGRAIVGVAFAHYAEGGVLAYEELLAALPVVSPGVSRVRHTIPRIWVTSETSMRGGRELWGIPKELAAFERAASGHCVATEMTLDGEPVAALDARVGPRLAPGTPRVPLATAQLLNGRATVSHNHVYARAHALRTTWSFAADGPLGFLAGRTPFLSVALRDAAVVFGRDVTRG